MTLLFVINACAFVGSTLLLLAPAWVVEHYMAHVFWSLVGGTVIGGGVAQALRSEFALGMDEDESWIAFVVLAFASHAATTSLGVTDPVATTWSTTLTRHGAIVALPTLAALVSCAVFAWWAVARPQYFFPGIFVIFALSFTVPFLAVAPGLLPRAGWQSWWARGGGLVGGVLVALALGFMAHGWQSFGRKSVVKTQDEILAREHTRMAITCAMLLGGACLLPAFRSGTMLRFPLLSGQALPLLACTVVVLVASIALASRVSKARREINELLARHRRSVSEGEVETLAALRACLARVAAPLDFRRVLEQVSGHLAKNRALGEKELAVLVESVAKSTGDAEARVELIVECVGAGAFALADRLLAACSREAQGAVIAKMGIAVAREWLFKTENASTVQRLLSQTDRATMKAICADASEPQKAALARRLPPGILQEHARLFSPSTLLKIALEQDVNVVGFSQFQKFRQSLAHDDASALASVLLAESSTNASTIVSFCELDKGELLAASLLRAFGADPLQTIRLFSELEPVAQGAAFAALHTLSDSNSRRACGSIFNAVHAFGALSPKHTCLAFRGRFDVLRALLSYTAAPSGAASTGRS